MLNEQIAKELADSGLFEWVESSTSILEIRFGGLPWPTADESEEVLAAMGLQVVLTDCGYELATIKDWVQECSNGSDYWGHYALELHDARIGAEEGQRTLANNAALAWMAKNRREDLERTLKEMGKL